MSSTGSSHPASPGRDRAAQGRDHTPELVAYFASVIGVFLASAVAGAGAPGRPEALFFVALLTIGYTFSRIGLPRPA